MRLANGSRAGLPGLALTIAASRLPMDGRRSTRNSASLICAAFPRTISFTTKPGGDRIRCCTYFPTGIGISATASQISVWVHSNVDSVEIFLNGKSQGSQEGPAPDAS